MLKSQNDRTGQALVGESNDSFYSTDEYERFLWPKIKVIDHDVGKVKGQFNQITFAPTDFQERCAKAVSMYPEGKVQLEIDFFHPRENVPMQVGHVGLSDMNHKYWPIAFMVSESENTEACEMLLNTAIDMIEGRDGQNAIGRVSTVLSDGGGAIHSSIDKINEERVHNGKTVIEKRRCFAHNIRMPNTKGKEQTMCVYRSLSSQLFLQNNRRREEGRERFIVQVFA